MSRTKTENYPVLVLRGRVIFPDPSVSLDVGRVETLTAVKCAADRDSMLFAVTQKDAVASWKMLLSRTVFFSRLGVCQS